jgi:hypothetical protein
MAYLNTEDVYNLFNEHGVANLHVVDIDSLPRMETIPNKAYKCYVEFDNGAKVEDKVVIVFANSEDDVSPTINKILCKYNDDYARILKIEKIEISIGDGFEIVNK